MHWIATRIRGIMLMAGMLTITMFYAAIAPQAALQSTFGDSLSGPVADVVVRNWGALIGLVGVMLIYGAFDASSRRVALTIASLSKLIFIGLVLSHGGQFLSHQAGLAVGVDALFVLLFGVYLTAGVGTIEARPTRGGL